MAPMTCSQSHGQCYPQQYELDLFHLRTYVFKVTAMKDCFCCLMCLSKDGGLPYNVTDQHKAETWTTKIPVLYPCTCFSRLISHAVSSQARKDGAALFQRQRGILPSALRFLRES